MCDYSLHCIASRDAEANETIVTTNFYGTSTRGFASPSDPTVAVCLRPGTELAFDETPKKEGALYKKSLPDKVARFCQVDVKDPTTHHDALEFPDGTIVKINDLVVGLSARVIQLPAKEQPTEAKSTKVSAPPPLPTEGDEDLPRARTLEHT